MEQPRTMRSPVKPWSDGSILASTSYKNSQESQQAHAQMLLPLPSLPPALAFDFMQFGLANTRTINIEKAFLQPPRPGSGSNVSTSRPASTALESPLPQLKVVQNLADSRTAGGLRTVRYIRFTLLTVYRRLFTLVILLNLLSLYPLLQRRTHGMREVLDPDLFALFASANLCLATLVRADFLIGLVFRAAWLVPWHVPLRLRLCVARLYCYGGIHAGAAVAGTVWWVVFTGAVSWRFLKESSMRGLNVVMALVTLCLLSTMILFASEPLRARYHNAFEITHRKLGWLVLVLFWIQLLLLKSCRVFTSPTFYLLAFTSTRTIYPWFLIRRWTFIAHPLSRDALRLSFSNRIRKFTIVSISSAPLREWHPFATFPVDGSLKNGSSLIMSAAGDWTRGVLASVTLQQQLQQASTNIDTAAINTLEKGNAKELKITFWVKPHPKPGVLSLSLLFPRILVLTTGSGIGPCMSSLLHRPAASQAARLVWSTRSPLLTYGADMMALVQRADPEALVIDTDRTGRPDLVGIALRVSREIEADAVFVLSNRKVTTMVVRGLEGRGVRAFGPIWDS